MNVYKEIRNKEGNIKLSIVYDNTICENPREWHNLGTMVCWYRRYGLGDEHNYDSPTEFYVDLVKKLYKNSKKVINVLIKEGMVKIKDFDKDEQEDIDYLVENLSKDNLEYLISISDELIILPLYLYDHGGITIKTNPFSCPWDSGQVGWIYAIKETFRTETSYTEGELFSKDLHREPKIGERVRIAEGWGQVIKSTIEETGYGECPIFVVDLDWNKYNNKKENQVEVFSEDIIEVMANKAEQMLKNEVKIYDYYLCGEVYGFILEESDECDCCEHEEWQEIDSCFGFYGNDFKNNGLFDEVGNEYQDLIDQLEKMYC